MEDEVRFAHASQPAQLALHDTHDIVLTARQQEEAIGELCRMKVADLAQLGYGTIDEQTLWAFISKDYAHLPPLHQWVSDIMSVQPPQLMHWMMMRAWKTPTNVLSLEQLLHDGLMNKEAR